MQQLYTYLHSCIILTYTTLLNMITHITVLHYLCCRLHMHIYSAQYLFAMQQHYTYLRSSLILIYTISLQILYNNIPLTYIDNSITLVSTAALYTQVRSSNIFINTEAITYVKLHRSITLIYPVALYSFAQKHYTYVFRYQYLYRLYMYA